MGHHRNNYIPANEINIMTVAERIAASCSQSVDDTNLGQIAVGDVVVQVDKAFGKKNGTALFPQVVFALQQQGFMVA